VLGYRTLSYLAFYLMDFGLPVDWRVDDAQEACAVMAAQDALGQDHAVLVANPLPLDRQLAPARNYRARRGPGGDHAPRGSSSTLHTLTVRTPFPAL